MLDILLKECTTIVDGLEIKYMFKPATQDVHHLIIIFSGFGYRSLFTYDFSGESLKDVPCSILWIKDEFDGEPCYYMCKHRDFHIENCVYKFITMIMDSCHLTKDNVTVLGASKGGTTSLYYGIKYHFKNIISSAGQINLGDFLELPSHSVTCKAMYDSNMDDNNDFFEYLLEKVINDVSDIDSNIYLIYSECDCYQDYSKINNLLRSKCKNYNEIKVVSNLVNSHNQITKYSVPFIKSILLQSIYGVSPRFKEVTLGNIKNFQVVDVFDNFLIEKKPEAYFEKISYNKNSLQINVISVDRFANEDSKVFLLLEGQHSYRLELKPIKGNNLNGKYYLYDYFDINNCLYELVKPINISKLKPSLYDISLVRVLGNIEKKTKLTSLKSFSTVLNLDNDVLGRIYQNKNDECVRLFLSQAISKYEPDLFIIEKSEISKTSLFFVGEFIKYGVALENYNDLDFYLVFKNIKTGRNLTYRIAKGSNNSLRKKFFEGEMLLSKAVFTMPGYNKFILGKDFVLVDGLYDVYISMILLNNISSVYSYKYMFIEVVNNEISFSLENKQKMVNGFSTNSQLWQ